MIVGYESWQRHVKPAKLMMQSMMNSIVEQVMLEVAKIQSLIPPSIEIRDLK